MNASGKTGRETTNLGVRSSNLFGRAILNLTSDGSRVLVTGWSSAPWYAARAKVVPQKPTWAHVRVRSLP
jgi:hypothetical protein